MKKFVSLIIILLLITSCGGRSMALETPYTILYNETISYTYDDINTISALIEEHNSDMKAAHQMANAARELGYSEDHDVIILAQKEWNEANVLYQEYKTIYDDLINHWEQKENEYPEASYIWKYFKELGYNNYVCAGILGNVMTEAGSNTLAIQPTVYSPNNTYYGICQWSKSYTGVRGVSLEEQCNFLKDTIKYEFDTYGDNYKRGFDYNSFLQLEDVEKAALAFAKSYERCGSSSYNARQKNAITAYNYFVS